MSVSHAKPNLTTPVDMSLLHTKDTGYHFIHHTFSTPAPELSFLSEKDEQKKMLQADAKSWHYQVWLGIPEQHADDQLSKSLKTSSKVLYMLDGNAAIDDLDKEILRMLSTSSPQNAAPVLVFIGYQTPYRFDVDARAYDYTPPLLSDKTGSKYAFQEDGRDRINGGAEHFYKMIEQEIKPWVYRQLGTKPKQEAIWGHSYGGLFVLYNLLEHPEAYQQYFSADPSLWWQKGEMTRYWQSYQKNSVAHLSSRNKMKNLRLTFSQSPEQTAPHAGKPSNKKPPTLLSKQDFAQEVCAHFEQSCSYQFFDQSHGEVFTTSLLESLKRF